MSAERPFSVEHAKSGRASCKDTKEKIPKGALKITKWAPPRDEDGHAMIFSYSLKGFTNLLAKARKAKVDDAEEINGFDTLDPDEQQQVQDAIDGVEDAKERIKQERAAARKAKAKSKKTKASGAAGAKGSPKKRVKKEEAPSLDPALPIADPDEQYQPKQVAEMLLKQCRNVPAMNRSLPADDAAARKKIGGFILSSNPNGPSSGHYDMHKAWAALIDGGIWKPKTRAGIEAVNPENQGLVTTLEELAGYAFKDSTFKGVTLMKAVKAIAALKTKVTDGSALAKGKTKVPGVGKSTGKKIDEYLENGQIEALENYKSA